MAVGVATNYKVFIDTTGCSNDWGMHTISVMNKVEAAGGLAEYHIIVPEHYVTDGTLAFVPYRLMKAIGKGQVHIHCIDVADKNLSTHLITTLLAQDMDAIKRRSQRANFYDYWFVLAKNTSYYVSMVQAVLKGYGLDDDDIKAMRMVFDYIGQA